MITTNWENRLKPTTDWGSRQKPTVRITKLQDNENVVCNENWQIIYIYADDWIDIATTIWTVRQK